MTRVVPSARPDTEVVFDPASYTGGVPFDALARLRRDQPVVWVAELPVLGWPEGPGFWLVLRHADVESVLTRPRRLLSRSFTPRAVSHLEDKIRGHARAICDEVLARTSSLSYAGAPSYLRSNFQRGVKRLPVAWTARSIRNQSNGVFLPSRT